ncbi:MAG: TadE/TadG family type IV pilus assembly protein [Pseudomonadota bacterium]
MKIKTLQFVKNQQGTTMMEFALAAPLLLLLLFGIFETGHLYYIRSNLQHAVYTAARYAMMNATASNSTISQKASEKVTAVSAGAVTISIQDQMVGGKPYKQISLAYNFSSVVGSLINYTNIPINVQSSVPALP